MNAHSNNRRDFLRTLGLGAASVVLSRFTSGAEPPNRKPNIVFILADDLGLHQAGCYGNNFYETPNVDSLAWEGMKFTSAYAACPVCSPTRVSIMTGKYPARLHLTDYIPGRSPKDEKLLPVEWAKFLPLAEQTIPEALKRAGYVFGHFGKWHLNKDKNYQLGRPGDPGSQGFDDVLTTRKPNSKSNPKKDPHHIDQITDRSIAFIKASKDKPFFCYVPHNAIHSPELEHPDLIAKYAAKPGADRHKNKPVHAAMVEHLDSGIGRILRTLDELKIADNTVVIYFSDNGALDKDQNVVKPLRGAKASLYEGGIRVPLVVRWPGVVKPGSTCDVPVISTDFFPTLVEAVGLKGNDPSVDGESLLPLLKQTGELNRKAIFWHYPHYHSSGIAPSGAIRMGDYKLIEWFEKSIDDIHIEDALELFNLKDDIGEQNNLAKKMPDKTAELYHVLKTWRESVNAQEMIKNPEYDSEKKTKI